MFRAVIVDDLEDARASLADDIATYCPDITVIGEASGVQTGIRTIERLKPDVVFLDVQLEDGLGFNILEKLPDFPMQVIFTTANDSYAIKAIKFSALDYLMKPIDVDELVAAVEKLKTQKQNRSQIELLANQLKQPATAGKIALNSADRIHLVNIVDIIRCESQRNYTLFYLTEKRQILVTRTLKEFDELLSANQFIRVHHSHLINLQHLTEFLKADGGYVLLSDGSKVPVSMRKKDDLLKQLGQL